MKIVCGKCGMTFESPNAAQQMKGHPCDVHKYPELKK